MQSFLGALKRLVGKSSLCKMCCVGARDIKLGKNVPWFVKVCQTCAPGPSNFADINFFQRNPVNLLNMNNINWQVTEWC